MYDSLKPKLEKELKRNLEACCVYLKNDGGLSLLAQDAEITIGREVKKVLNFCCQ